MCQTKRTKKGKIQGGMEGPGKHSRIGDFQVDKEGEGVPGRRNSICKGTET